MSQEKEKALKNFSKIKEEGSSFLSTIVVFVQNSIATFRKSESEMTVEEKVDKQHILTFIYGMVAGVIVYHFLIGAILIVGLIVLYSYSVKKTKKLMHDKES